MEIMENCIFLLIVADVVLMLKRQLILRTRAIIQTTLASMDKVSISTEPYNGTELVGKGFECS